VTPAQERRPPPAQRERQTPPKRSEQHEVRSWAEIAASAPQSTRRTVSSPAITATPTPPPISESSQTIIAQAIAAALAPITAQMTALQAEFKALRTEPMEFEEFSDLEDGEFAAANSQSTGTTSNSRPAKSRKLKLKQNR